MSSSTVDVGVCRCRCVSGRREEERVHNVSLVSVDCCIFKRQKLEQGERAKKRTKQKTETLVRRLRLQFVGQSKKGGANKWGAGGEKERRQERKEKEKKRALSVGGLTVLVPL